MSGLFNLIKEIWKAVSRNKTISPHLRHVSDPPPRHSGPPVPRDSPEDGYAPGVDPAAPDRAGENRRLAAPRRTEEAVAGERDWLYFIKIKFESVALLVGNCGGKFFKWRI